MATILAADGGPVEATFSPAPSWQQAMKRAIRDGRSLCARLRLPETLASGVAQEQFSVFAPLEYVARMRPEDPNDPLLLQVLGRHEEHLEPGSHAATGVGSSPPEATLDAVGDLAAQRGAGLLQKYDSRVLMITSGACAVHCRYCFRRHFPYGEVAPGKLGWQSSLAIIRRDRSLDEVILSGGDPLTVADEQLAWLIKQIDAMPHIQRIRIHTRVPVVIPQRICDSLVRWAESSRAAIFFVLHFNHAAEIDDSVRGAMRRLRRAGVTLLNQAVLLRGVNDTPRAQRELCLALVNMQVLPYYLHQLDLVHGALHFEVDDDQARDILHSLRSTLPGYAVPKLVREIAGHASKTPV